MEPDTPAHLPFDPARRDAFLHQALPQVRGELALQRIGGGQSNPTLILRAAWLVD